MSGWVLLVTYVCFVSCVHFCRCPGSPPHWAYGLQSCWNEMGNSPSGSLLPALTYSGWQVSSILKASLQPWDRKWHGHTKVGHWTQSSCIMMWPRWWERMSTIPHPRGCMYMACIWMGLDGIVGAANSLSPPPKYYSHFSQWSTSMLWTQLTIWRTPSYTCAQYTKSLVAQTLHTLLWWVSVHPLPRPMQPTLTTGFWGVWHYSVTSSRLESKQQILCAALPHYVIATIPVNSLSCILFHYSPIHTVFTTECNINKGLWYLFLEQPSTLCTVT